VDGFDLPVRFPKAGPNIPVSAVLGVGHRQPFEYQIETAVLHIRLSRPYTVKIVFADVRKKRIPFSCKQRRAVSVRCILVSTKRWRREDPNPPCYKSGSNFVPVHDEVHIYGGRMNVIRLKR